jgi:hypothetical protein
MKGLPVHQCAINSLVPRNLYFDAETFQHVRSQYEYTVSARQGSRAEASVSQRDNRYKLVEDFSDFQRTGKLMLPHKYTIELTVETQNRTQTLEWTINFQQFSFTETIDPSVFKG